MLDLTDNAITDMDFNTAFLAESFAVSPKDFKTSKAKLVASVPTDGFQWQKIILQFANLLFLLFGPSCPLYVKVLNIIKTLC